jgi:hypothetical protein
MVDEAGSRTGSSCHDTFVSEVMEGMTWVKDLSRSLQRTSSCRLHSPRTRDGLFSYLCGKRFSLAMDA